MIDHLLDYLSNRPFAPILDKLTCTQKRCVRALKLMCLIDAQIDDDDLYGELTNREEMMFNLMTFDYCLFKYYDYQTLRKTEYSILKCKYCDLVSDYCIMLTHMAISHNAHVGLKMCAYCELTELGEHTGESFERCQKNYYKEHGIKKNFVENNLVKDFYRALRRVVLKIDVAEEALEALHGHSFPQFIGFVPRCVKIDDIKFAAEFEKVVEKFRIRLPGYRFDYEDEDGISGEVVNRKVPNTSSTTKTCATQTDSQIENEQPVNDDLEVISISSEDSSDDSSFVDGSSERSQAIPKRIKTEPFEFLKYM